MKRSSQTLASPPRVYQNKLYNWSKTTSHALVIRVSGILKPSGYLSMHNRMLSMEDRFPRSGKDTVHICFQE